MAKETKKRFIVFDNGDKKEIVGETGKYWITKNGQVRRLDKSIADIVEEKKTEKKKKKAEEEQEIKEEFDAGFDEIPDVSDLM